MVLIIVFLFCSCYSFTTSTQLSYVPSRIFKGVAVTLTCIPDNPTTNATFTWLRGRHKLQNAADSTLTITASLDTRNNFTCITRDNSSAEVSINVLAPPAFIKRPPLYQGIPYDKSDILLTCRIECYPLCDIVWYRDDQRINPTNNPFYYMFNRIVPADDTTNDFESIESTLVWIMKDRPFGMLTKSSPPAEYTCASVSGSGRDIKSTTAVAVDYPPEDLTISSSFVVVKEHETPEPVKCLGRGRPTLNYLWKIKATSEIIGEDNTLLLKPMIRSSPTNYTCIGFNKYGNLTADVFFAVHYKPTCYLNFGQVFNRRALVCSADSQPPDFDFKWEIFAPAARFELTPDNIVRVGTNSYLLFNDTVDVIRTARCTISNYLGESTPCERTIPGALPNYGFTHLEKSRANSSAAFNRERILFLYTLLVVLHVVLSSFFVFFVLVVVCLFLYCCDVEINIKLY